MLFRGVGGRGTRELSLPPADFASNSVVSSSNRPSSIVCVWVRSGGWSTIGRQWTQPCRNCTTIKKELQIIEAIRSTLTRLTELPSAYTCVFLWSQWIAGQLVESGSRAELTRLVLELTDKQHGRWGMIVIMY